MSPELKGKGERGKLGLSPSFATTPQPFDPVKPAGQSVLKHVTPNAAGAIGAIAGLETLVDGCDELRIMDLARAVRAVEPCVKA